jgi:hypothetical protein
MNRNRALGAVVFFLAVTACLAWAGAAASDKAPATGDANAKLAFEKLKGLAGHWEATGKEGKTTTSYEVVANGTAILERIHVPGDKGEMLTVYHLDGDRLVLTHYCEAGNQPHMQAEPFNPASNQLRFDFAGGGNLADLNAGHMHSVVFTFAGADALNADWAWQQDGKPGFHAQMEFHRVR